jgi:hypothetical protein
LRGGEMHNEQVGGADGLDEDFLVHLPRG